MRLSRFDSVVGRDQISQMWHLGARRVITRSSSRETEGRREGKTTRGRVEYSAVWMSRWLAGYIVEG